MNFEEESVNEMKRKAHEMIHRITLEFVFAEEWDWGHEF